MENGTKMVLFGLGAVAAVGLVIVYKASNRLIKSSK